jgi:3-oxoadipate enol-lactonase
VGLDHTFWDDIAADLEKDFRVVRPDARGHGSSPNPPGPWTMRDIADDVAALIEELALPPVHVFGQSFGGLVAQELVLGHPHLVRSLILSGTSCTTSPAEREVFLGRAADARAGGMEAVTQRAIDRWFTLDFLGSDTVTRVRQRLLSNSVEGWARTFEAIAEHNTLEALGVVQQPALVVVGGADVATPPRMSEELAAAIPAAHLTVLPGVPHMGPFERPDLFIPLIREFISPHTAA